MKTTACLYSYYFNGKDSAERIEQLNQLDHNRPHWLHFDYSLASSRQWLEAQKDIPEVVLNALLNEETRPRATQLKEGVLISLRGVNLAPDKDPEDMVSIRIWLTPTKVISTQHRTLLSTQNIANDFDAGEGPQSSGGFVTIITEYLINNMGNTINEIEDRVSEIEEHIIESSNYSLRNDLSVLRRQSISLRRYLAPQKEAMLQLLSEKITLFSHDEKLQLRETTDQLTRYIEDLDSVKDRAAVSQEELSNRLAEAMNNRMYVLSIVTAVFLPLGFLTGLLGVNIGGIPGTENTSAFTLFGIILIVITSIQIVIFKYKKWF